MVLKFVLALLAALCLAGPAMADPPVDVYPPGYYKTGDVVQRASGSVQVPAPGEWLEFQSLGADESEARILVTHLTDDSVSVITEDIFPRPIGDTETYDSNGDILSRNAATQPGACDSSEANAWNKNPVGDGTWSKIDPASMPWHWRVRANMPTNQADTINAMKDSYLAWPQVNTNCNYSGSGDSLSSAELSTTYDGTTTANAQITISNGEDACTIGQPPNIISFGDLAGSASSGASLAVTCVQGSTLCQPADCSNGAFRYQNSADFKFNTNDYDFIADIGPNCSGKWAYRAVGTHEVGHVMGLDHVSDDLHPNQTMSPYINKVCKQPEYTLGRGDITGIKALYDN